MTGKLDNKIALVTGGSSGIGLATAKEFVKQGAYVFISGRRQAELDAAVAAIGHNVTAVQGDIAALADIDRLVKTIRDLKGRLDVVFANAGGGDFVTVEELTEAHYDTTFDINVKGVAFTVQKTLPLLQDGSSIILNSSIQSWRGTPAFSVYSATKAALRSFARSWTVDLKHRHIRVNVVSPGYIPTAAHDRLGITQEAIAEAATHIPLGRVGTAEEVAKAVLFLACDDSSYITGIDLPVDGGLGQI
jgi:NAD(P)-dependent dehydrogenase (short-subunit alcohol dehydrogenase family)